MRDPRNSKRIDDEFEQMPFGRSLVIGAIAGLGFWAAVGFGFFLDMAF